MKQVYIQAGKWRDRFPWERVPFWMRPRWPFKKWFYQPEDIERAKQKAEEWSRLEIENDL